MITPYRIWNWCRRIKHRRGYGVHSPTDFFLITSVIYEMRSYYAYRMLKLHKYDYYLPHYRSKINRLLFRLVNFYQPPNLIEVGCENGEAFSYMRAASQKMIAFSVRMKEKEMVLSQMEKYLEEVEPVGCLHIGHTPFYKEVYETAIPYVSRDSWFVVGGIHQSREKRMWWKQVKDDPRTGITYDLFDIGLIFFDKNRYKEHYIVNFL